MKTRYIAQLPIETQHSIREELQTLGLKNEDIENAMASRLCDLEDTIDIGKYMKNSSNGVSDVISEDCRVNKENVEEFHSFIMGNLFVDLPRGASCELTNVYTTFSYLNHRYVIKIPNSNKVLSIIILANYLGADKVFKDYLRSDFAFLNESMDTQVSGVRVFENNFDEFKQMFYQSILPMFH